MFLIVLHHVCLYGSLRDLTPVVGAFSVFTHFATDAFVFISGWYGINVTAKRLFRFLGIGLVCAVEVALLSVPVGIKTFRYSFGWFGWSYLALMLMAPVLNSGMEALAEKGGKSGLTKAWVLLTVAFAVSWAFEIVPGWASHTFSTVFYVYLTGRYLRLRLPDRWAVGKSWMLLACFAGLTAFNFAWAYCGSAYGGFFVGTRGFNAPWIIASAICAVFLFSNLRLGAAGDFIGKYLAPSAFPVYLIHHGCNEKVGKAFYLPLQQFLFQGVKGTPGAEVLAVVCTASIVFCACLCIDLARRFAFSLAWKEKK